MKVLYFARFRQLIGRGHDNLEIPPEVKTVSDLIAHLMAHDVGCAAAFANIKTVKTAVDQQHVGLDHLIGGAKEIAFFPPVTGG